MQFMLLASSPLLFRKLMAAIVLLAKIIGPTVDIAMTPRRPQKEPVNHVLVKRQFNFTAKALVDYALHKAARHYNRGYGIILACQ